ncbi:MAG: hypothetical protein ACJA2X_001078 [Halocynthiibacter sp.]|jgi:hypothetical protein
MIFGALFYAVPQPDRLAAISVWFIVSGENFARAFGVL